MIQFNVSPTRNAAEGNSHGLDATSLRDRTSRWWTCSDEKLAQFGDFAFAVEANRVAGVYRINGWTRDPKRKRVELKLSSVPTDHPATRWIGHRAPVPWEPGQRQPFKYVSRVGLLPAAPERSSERAARETIYRLARAGERYLLRLPDDLGSGFKVARAYVVWETVYRILEEGTPIQGGPRLLDPPAQPHSKVGRLHPELTSFARQVANGAAVSPHAAERYAEQVRDALRTIRNEVTTPVD